MTISDPSAGYELDATVYDVNGNEIGTLAEIYPDASGRPIPLGTPASRPV